MQYFWLKASVFLLDEYCTSLGGAREMASSPRDCRATWSWPWRTTCTLSSRTNAWTNTHGTKSVNPFRKNSKSFYTEQKDWSRCYFHWPYLPNDNNVEIQLAAGLQYMGEVRGRLRGRTLSFTAELRPRRRRLLPLGVGGPAAQEVEVSTGWQGADDLHTAAQRRESNSTVKRVQYYQSIADDI